MKRVRFISVLAMVCLIALGGTLAAGQAQAQYTGFAQITVINQYDTSVRFYLDNQVMDDIGPGFTRTYQVKPGYHFLEAVTLDGRKISRSIELNAGDSKGWTLKVVWQ